MSGIERIAAERRRQVEVEGWSPERDDGYDCDELALAATCYAAPMWCAVHQTIYPGGAPSLWPWDVEWWKPAAKRGDDYETEDRIRDLEKAGALIVAEIDRLERSDPPEPRPLPDPDGPTQTIEVWNGDGRVRQYDNSRVDGYFAQPTWADEGGNPPEDEAEEYSPGSVAPYPWRFLHDGPLAGAMPVAVVQSVQRPAPSEGMYPTLEALIEAARAGMLPEGNLRLTVDNDAAYLYWSSPVVMGEDGEEEEGEHIKLWDADRCRRRGTASRILIALFNLLGIPAGPA